MRTITLINESIRKSNILSYLDIDDSNVFYAEHTNTIVIIRSLPFSEVESVYINNWAKVFEDKVICFVEDNKIKLRIQ
jgi:hypothetical protein